MALSADQKRQVMNQVQFYVEKAMSYYRIPLSIPKVDFDLKGCDAGQAVPAKNTMSLNAVLLEENFDRFLTDTIPHEIAHIICYAKYGWIKTARGGISHHGKEWKQIMVRLGCVPTRCHDMDTSKVKRKMRSFSYFCTSCKACFPLSTIRHNRAVKGTIYRHKNCKGAIEFIEEIK